jgi:hypothetical protein
VAGGRSGACSSARVASIWAGAVTAAGDVEGTLDAAARDERMPGVDVGQVVEDAVGDEGDGLALSLLDASGNLTTGGNVTVNGGALYLTSGSSLRRRSAFGCQRVAAP